jgi:uncharacterized protein
MFCPSCQNTLRERQRGDVMLDICPGCGGVWLDRGELEKLTTSERSYYRRGDDDDDDDDDDDEGWGRGRSYETRSQDDRSYGPPNGDRSQYDTRDGRQSGTRPKKRGGFLENIFGNFGEGGADD